MAVRCMPRIGATACCVRPAGRAPLHTCYSGACLAGTLTACTWLYRQPCLPAHPQHATHADACSGVDMMLHLTASHHPPPACYHVAACRAR